MGQAGCWGGATHPSACSACSAWQAGGGIHFQESQVCPLCLSKVNLSNMFKNLITDVFSYNLYSYIWAKILLTCLRARPAPLPSSPINAYVSVHRPKRCQTRTRSQILIENPRAQLEGRWRLLPHHTKPIVNFPLDSRNLLSKHLSHPPAPLVTCVPSNVLMCPQLALHSILCQRVRL